MGVDPSKLPDRYKAQVRAGGVKAPRAVSPVTVPPVPAPPVVSGAATCEVAVVMMGKPRMTQRDKWAKRPNVMRYRQLADVIRAAVPKSMLVGVIGMDVDAYFPMPKSWPKARQQQFAGKLHQTVPDYDNVAKAAGDILFEDDRALAFGRTTKYWDDGRGPRILLTFYYEHPNYAGMDPAEYRKRPPRRKSVDG